MRLLVLAMAACRHEELLSIGTRALELQRAAGVAGGGMCVVCGVCGEDEGVAEALEM